MSQTVVNRSFTSEANRALALATEEAARLNHGWIGTEHILLGIVRQGNGIAARVLARYAVDLPHARKAVEFIIGRGEVLVTNEPDYSPRAKKVLQYAIESSQQLGHDLVGTEHLLLGLVREGGGIGVGVIESRGANLETIRLEVLKAIPAPSNPKMRRRLENCIRLIPLSDALLVCNDLVPIRLVLQTYLWPKDRSVLKWLNSLPDGDKVAFKLLRDLVIDPFFEEYGPCPGWGDIFRSSWGNEPDSGHVKACPVCGPMFHMMHDGRSPDLETWQKRWTATPRRRWKLQPKEDEACQ